MGLLARLGLARSRDVVALQQRLLRERQASSSGVPISFGQFEYESTKELQSSKRWDVYERMEADPEVKAALMQVVHPILNAEWQFEAASDKRKDVEIKELCDANLLCRHDGRFGYEYAMQTPWRGQRLLEILDFLRAGFSLFAKSWRVVDGTAGLRRVYDRVQWLEPASVDPSMGWDLNASDEIVAVKRTFQDPTGRYRVTEPIPARDLALYVHDLKGARYEGRPFIRSMYGAWMRKDFLQRMSAIWAQKVGAPMPYGFYPTSYTAEERDRFTEGVQSMRGTSPPLAHFVGPIGNDGVLPVLAYADVSGGEVDRVGKLVERENSEIGRAGFRGSMQLGQKSEGSGSRAVAADQSATEYAIVESIARTIIEQESKGVGNLRGLIQELVDENYPGIREYPRLSVRQIRPDEVMALEKRRIEAWSAGVLPRDPEVRKQISQGLEFELPDEAYEVEELIPSGGVPGKEGTLPASPGNGQSGEVREEPEREEYQAASRPGPEEIARIKQLPSGSKVVTDEGGRGAKPRGWFRSATEFEATFVALGEIEREMTLYEQRYYAVAAGILRDTERDLVGRVRSGAIHAGNFTTLRQREQGPNVRYYARLRDAIAKILRQTSRFGAEQVRGEMKRQRA